MASRTLAFALGLTLLLSGCSSQQGESSSMPESSSGADGQTSSSAASSEEPADSSYQKLTPEEAKARMETNPDAIILDVRSKEEYEEGHVPGAVLLPLPDIGDQPPALLPDFEGEILAYCRSGNRSKQAAEKLLDLGYTDVKDFGGIRDWPYDIVTD